MWTRASRLAENHANASCGIDLLAFQCVTDRLEASRRSWVEAVATVGAMPEASPLLHSIITENTGCWTALLCDLADRVVTDDPEIARLNRLLSQLANRAIHYGQIATARIEYVDMLIDINNTLLTGLRPLAGGTGRVRLWAPLAGVA